MAAAQVTLEEKLTAMQSSIASLQEGANANSTPPADTAAKDSSAIEITP